MTIIIGAVISAALAAAAAYLLAPKPPDIPVNAETGASQAHIRGTILPLLLGHTRVAPIIGYVGNRRAYAKTVGKNDGGPFHHTEKITETRYVENAAHFLCIGPALRIKGILEGGKYIYENTLHKASVPNGSSFTCTDGSTFKVYWGDETQPVDTVLATLTGVATSYPFTCYIHWTRKELGAQPLWKNVEYIVECASLGEDADYMDLADDYSPVLTANRIAGTSVISTTDVRALDMAVGQFLSIQTYTGTISSIVENGGNYLITVFPSLPYTVSTASSGIKSWWEGGRGVNPGRIIKQLLLQDFPHGLGWDTSLVDLTSLDTNVTDVMDPGGAEPSPSTIYLKGGRTLKEGLAMVLSDQGILMYPDAVTGVFKFKLLREGDTPVQLEADYYNAKGVSRTAAYSILAPNKKVYAFIEATRSYQQSTILISDDGHARLSGDPNTKKQSINTVMDLVTASRIASRKEQETRITGDLIVPVSSDKRDLELGDLVELVGLTGAYRLISKKANPGASEFEASFLIDAYSIPNQYVEQSTAGVSVPLPISPDVIVMAMEANRYINKDQAGYYIFRTRASGVAAFATAYRSEDDVTYNSVQSLSYQTGGVLSEAVVEDGPGILGTLDVQALGDDFLDFIDLTLSESEWRKGALVVVIGKEFLFPKEVTALGGGLYRMSEILRGRAGTKKEAHTVGADFSLFYLNSIQFIEDSLILADTSLYIKCRPFSSFEVLPLEDVSSVSFAYGGGGHRPLPPDNLNTTNGAFAWLSGTDPIIRWDYKNASVVSGAGMSLSDETASLSPPEGSFLLYILNGATVVRTEEVSSSTFTYTQAMMVTDFGAEPASFNVEVVEILNGLTSESDTATIMRV